ncbi:hypothetical protein CLU86_1150 [Acidovorax sp. 62]|nr:hypothetical protein CLU86_1150 [Acidovorax sp. 62]
MLMDAFTTLITGVLQQHTALVILAVMAVASVIAGLLVFQRGVSAVLDFISGVDSSRPRVGYQYEEYDQDGKATYRTWTKKDQYYYDKSRSRR